MNQKRQLRATTVSCLPAQSKPGQGKPGPIYAVLTPERSSAAARRLPVSGPTSLLTALPFRHGGPLAVKAPPPGKKPEKPAQELNVVEGASLQQTARPPAADILPFLRPVGVMEARFIRVLSNLCSLTYYMNEKITTEGMQRRHEFKLVSTSLICEKCLRNAPPAAREVFSEADAMAADSALVRAALAPSVEEAGAATALQAVQRIEPIAGAPAAPADLVAASLAAAAAAASSAASAVAASAAGVYTAAGSFAGPVANNISTFTASLPVRSVATQLQSAAAAGQSTAAATIATLATALDAAWSGSRSSSRSLAKEAQSPTHWFVVDDEPQHTRMFVIQGSDNLDHWRVNLTFDPVPFEDPALGIKVHRGVYETAQALYERFLPMVEEHLSSSPFAKVCFTGHSLGGSLATLLMLMLVRRGVVPLSALLPVYTFGAPAIFCEGAAMGCCCGRPSCEGDCSKACSVSEGAHTAAAQHPQGILAKLDLPQGAVRNVIMARDIVPRAFACDYSLVADLLKRLRQSFAEHRCLNSDRQVLYTFIGQMYVLQPHEAHSFVAPEERGGHPLLPGGPGLYLLRQPHSRAEVAEAAAAPAAAEPRANASSSSKPAPRPPRKQGVASSVREAVWELMNNPHPLDMLADPAAYGDAGQISRYHNPDNYTRAIGGVLRNRRSHVPTLVRHARRAGLRYHVPQLQPRAGAAGSAAAGEAALSPTAPGSKQQLIHAHRKPAPLQRAV